MANSRRSRAIRRVDEDVASRIVAFVRDRCESGVFRCVNVALFGGEPLLNPRGCELIMELLRAEGLLGEVQLITNGIILNERIYLRLVQRGLTGVQVTLDGMKDTHDRTRSTLGGSGTFDQIIENLRVCMSAAPGGRWNIRVNVTSNSYDEVDTLIAHLASRLDLSRNKVFLTLGIIDDNGVGFSDVVRSDRDLFEWVTDRYVGAVRRGFNYHLIGQVSECVFCSTPEAERGAVIGSQGELYSCWESVGHPDRAVGHVDSGYESPAALQTKWRRCCDFSRNQPHGGVAGNWADFVDVSILDYERSLRKGEVFA